jgi:hypothetical protein
MVDKNISKSWRRKLFLRDHEGRMSSGPDIQKFSMWICLKCIRELAKHITLFFSRVKHITGPDVIVRNVSLMKFIEGRNKVPTEFLKLSNIPFAVIVSSILNDLTKVNRQILVDKKVSEMILFLQIGVDAKGVIEFNEIGRIETIDSFINVFLVEDAFIKLAFELFELSLDERNWFMVVPASVKHSVKIKCVKEDLFNSNVEGHFEEGFFEFGVESSRYFEAVLIGFDHLKDCVI